MDKIVLEEHFVIPDFLDYLANAMPRGGSTAAVQTNRKLKMPPSSYLKSNFSVTTSGQFSDVPLACAISALGEDNVMFSIDYPYKDSKRRGTIH
jgi:predicted TIM-barrel fold metal-dependent hydrolase